MKCFIKAAMLFSLLLFVPVQVFGFPGDRKIVCVGSNGLPSPLKLGCIKSDWRLVSVVKGEGPDLYYMFFQKPSGEVVIVPITQGENWRIVEKSIVNK